MHTIPPTEWIERCRQRISALDSSIEPAESYTIALHMVTVERLRGLPPENAVDLAASQIASGQRTSFERRAVPRSPRATLDN